MPFIIAGAGLLGGIGGGLLQGSASKRAAGEVSGAQRYAADLEQKRYNQNREDMAPWRDAGGKALGEMDSMMYGDPNEISANFQKTPGYQFRLDEGLKALQRSAGSVTGNTLRSLMDYGQGSASAEFGNRYNRLAGLAGTGQSATQFSAEQGARSAENQGAYAIGAANTRASSYLGQSQIYGNMLGSLASAGMGAMGGGGGFGGGFGGGDYYGGGRVAPGGSFGGASPYAGAGGYGDNWTNY